MRRKSFLGRARSNKIPGGIEPAGDADPQLRPVKNQSLAGSWTRATSSADRLNHSAAIAKASA